MTFSSYVRQEKISKRSFLEYLKDRAHIKYMFMIGWFVFLFVSVINISYSVLLKSNPVVSSDVIQSDGQVAGSQTKSEVVTEPEIKEDELAIIDENVRPNPKKQSYKIALYGDSMIETMGPKLEFLSQKLKALYPSTTFTLYNYGIGAENVDTGLTRIYKPLKRDERDYPPITSIDADIIILGSYAYNPFSPHDRDKHWLSLAKLIEEFKKTGADIYLLAENAPLRSDFGKGPTGVNWETASAYEHSGRIIQQLENAVGLSKNLNIVLINVFEKTIINSRNEGKRIYVNQGDGIHPSNEGHEFTAEEISYSLILD